MKNFRPARSLSNFLFLTAMLALLALSYGCQEAGPFKEDMVFAGGKKVSRDHLNLGYTTYQEYCVQCHGNDGDGNGPAAKGLNPPPRNFKQGIYKFGTVVAGELPTDEDFYRIIRKGLHGTAMLPWDISDERLDAVVQYIKALAPEVWTKEGATVGEPIALVKDPYGLARKTSAIEKGKAVYHFVANCQTCHRAYASPNELKKMAAELNTSFEYDPEIYKIKPQASEYGVSILPPDFTWHEVRSAQSVDELFVRISAGVAGTTMPSWKGTIEDDDIWAVAYYIKHLMELKKTPERDLLMNKLKVR